MLAWILANFRIDVFEPRTIIHGIEIYNTPKPVIPRKIIINKITTDKPHPPVIKRQGCSSINAIYLK